MTQARVRAVYMRGGTSRCLVFHEGDLPAAGPERDYILLAALGSPDPYGRQLDGLGGGISSLSKACIIGPATHPGADVDYTFAQVEVGKAHVDYTGNCGNCSSAVGPFAIEERIVQPVDGETLVRIHNTNTKKLIAARVPVAGSEPAVHGDFALPGVAATPKIAMVTAPVDTVALDGTSYDASAYDVVARAISMSNCHRAFPLTSSMCLAVAARIEGTLVHECSMAASGADVRLGHPSGVLPLDAAVARQGGDYVAERVTVYRTARRLMEGWVRIP